MYFSLFYLFNWAKFTSEKKYNFNNNYIFEQTSNLHFKILNESKFEEIPIILEFQNKTSKKKNGIIENYNFKNNYFRKVRISYFNSDDKQMFNSVWYPSYDYECPILTIDFVNFGKNESLFFLNLIHIYKDEFYEKKYSYPLLEIKKKYNFLYNNSSVHLVQYKNCLSKTFLYGEFNKSEIETLVPDILEKYLSKYLTYFLKKPVNRYFIEEKHREYNILRKNIESNYITKEYFDDDWFNRLIIEINR